jgi:hypothetical protein
MFDPSHPGNLAHTCKKTESRAGMTLPGSLSFELYLAGRSRRVQYRAVNAG